MPITNPTDIPGLAAWYDARLETGVVDGGTLTQMTDQSGNGNHALADGTPKWAATGGPDGGARYNFDGTGCFVLPTDILDTAVLGAESAVVNGTTYNGVGAEVMASIKAGGSGPHWSFSSDGDSNGFADPGALHPSYASIVTDGFGSPRGSAHAGGVPARHMMPLPVGDTAWHSYDVSSFGSGTSAGLHRARIDGVVQNFDTFLGSGGQQPRFQDAPCIGAEGAGSLVLYTGDFGCILVFQRRLTDQERADLYEWLDMPTRTRPPGDTFETAIEIVPVDGTYVSPPQAQIDFSTATKGTVESNYSVWWKYTAPVDGAARLKLDFGDSSLDGLPNYIPSVNIFVDDTKKNTSNLTISSGVQTVVLDPGQTCTVVVGNGWSGYNNYFTYDNTNPPNNVEYVLTATVEAVTRPDNDSRWQARELTFPTDTVVDWVDDADLLTKEPDEPAGTGRPYASAWWKYTPDVDTRLDWNTYLSWTSKWNNLVRNPWGSLGTGGIEGWTAVTPGSSLYQGNGGGAGVTTLAYQHVNAAGVAGVFRTELMPLVAGGGNYVSGQFGHATATSGHYVLATLEAYDASQALIGTQAFNSRTQSARRGQLNGYATPAGTAYVALRFDVYPNSFSTDPPSASAFVELFDVALEQNATGDPLNNGLTTTTNLYREDGVGVLTLVSSGGSPTSVQWRTGVRLTATLEPDETYYLVVGNYNDEVIPAGRYGLIATRTTLPSNDSRFRATPITFTGGEFTSEVTASNFLTFDNGETGSRTAWWAITPAHDMVIDFDTALTTGDADISTRISVFAPLVQDSFETGIGNWESDAAASLAPTTEAYDGSAAMEITTVDNFETFVSRVDAVPASATNEYLVSGYFRRPAMDAANTTVTVRPVATFYDSAGAVLSTTNVGAISMNAAAVGPWRQAVGGGTAPAGTASVKLRAYLIYASGTAGLVIQADAMEMVGLLARGTSTLAGVALEAGKTYYIQVAQTGTARNLQYVLHAVDQSPVEEQPTEQTIDLVSFTGEGTLTASSGLSIKRTAAFQGVGSLVVVPKPRFIANFTSVGTLAVTAVRMIVPELTLMVLDTNIERAPGPLTVVVLNANPDSEVTFTVDGVEVYVITTDTDGEIAPTSFNVPDDLMAGTYTLEVSQSGTVAAAVDFTILRDPPTHATDRGPDAQAVDVPGAAYGDRRHWVLQDLMPGGLGSWVMPISPRESSSPYLQRQLTVQTTTAGRNHVIEGSMVPVEWTFSGFAPTEDFAETLQSYVDLNRRCYVIDHRGRAFKVVFLGVDLQPRLQSNYNGTYIDGHDYTVTALVLDQEWVTPA